MSIRYKLIIPVLLAFVTLAVLLHFLWLPGMLKYDQESIVEHEHRVLRALAPGLIHSILIGDLSSIYLTLDRQITNTAENQLSNLSDGNSTHAQTWRQVVLSGSDGKRLYPLTEPVIANDEYVIKINHELLWEGQIIGHISIDVNWHQKFVAQRSRVIEMELWALLVFGLIVTGTIIWQNRYIRSPLVRIAHAADELAKGKFSTPLPKFETDEVGRLTNAFSEMRVALQDKHRELLQAVSQANNSETEQRAIVNTMLNGLITIDQAGMVKSFSPAAERLFGYSADEMIDRNVSVLMPESDAKQHDSHLSRYKNNQRPSVIGLEREIIGLRKDGTEFPMEISLSTTKVNGKQIIVGIVHNISERVLARDQLRAQKEQLSRILENTKDAYLMLDRDWCVTYANQVTKLLLNVKPDKILGTDLRETMPKLVKIFQHSLFSAFNDKQTDQCLALYEPTMKYLETFVYPTNDGLIVHFHDTTKQKKVQDDLRLAKLAADVANSAKSELLARMSHELRTPMNAIIGYGQLLETDREDLSEDQLLQIGYILTAANKLLKLINNVLDISRAGNGDIEISIELVSLQQIIDTSVNLRREMALKKDITLDVSETTLSASCDPQYLMQVLDNLLSNAIKYNKKGGAVQVKVELVTAGCLRIVVADSGCGINSDDQLRIFDPFIRASDWKAEVEGDGIGLTISQKLVELMDGQIGCDSEHGKGSTFWVELPVADGSKNSASQI